jgi:hypothetical protein
MLRHLPYDVVSNPKFNASFKAVQLGQQTNVHENIPTNVKFTKCGDSRHSSGKKEKEIYIF